MKYEKLEAWKNAVWEYLLEHSDMMESGALFVKFHTDDRDTFEDHVYARLKHKYHRTDVGARNAEHLLLREADRAKKAAEEKYWQASEEERKRVFAELKQANRGQPEAVKVEAVVRKNMRAILREFIYRNLLRSHGKLIRLLEEKTP